MSVWTTGEAVPVRRSSRRLSVTASDLEAGSSEVSTPSKATPRKLLHPKSSMIPRLRQIDEKMASSDDDVVYVPVSESKRGRGRPRKDSPGRKMTAIKTLSSPAKEAAAAAATSLSTARVKREVKTPPSRSRSSSRSRKSASSAASGTITASKQQQATAAATATLPKIQAVLDFDDSPVVTRRSTRIASKAPVNGHANGSGVQEVYESAKTTQPRVSRETTEQWREKFTEEHPFFTKMFIPAMICLVYALIIIGVGYYFNVHNQATVWMEATARSINKMYDEFMEKYAGPAEDASNSEI